MSEADLRLALFGALCLLVGLNLGMVISDGIWSNATKRCDEILRRYIDATKGDDN